MREGSTPASAHPPTPMIRAMGVRLLSGLVVVLITGCGLIREPEVGLACQLPAGQREAVQAAPMRPEYIGLTPAEAADLAEANDLADVVT